MNRLYIGFIVVLFSFTSYADEDRRLSYIYNENSINFISDNQVNAIEFSIPIAQVNSPPGQFDKSNQSISYVNNNKTMLFYLSSGVHDVQFMVTMLNGRVLSLHFKGDKLQGRVVHIPEFMSESVTKDKKNKNKSFDLKIKNLMQSAFFDNGLGVEWLKIKELSGGKYKKFNIKKYTEWDNYYYKISKWDFCSNSKNILYIDSRKQFNNKKILATTLVNKKLMPHECSKLIVLYDKVSHGDF